MALLPLYLFTQENNWGTFGSYKCILWDEHKYKQMNIKIAISDYDNLNELHCYIKKIQTIATHILLAHL